MICAFIDSVLYPDGINFDSPPQSIYEVIEIKDIPEDSIEQLETSNFPIICEVDDNVTVGMIYDPHENTIIDYKWCYITHPYTIIKGANIGTTEYKSEEAEMVDNPADGVQVVSEDSDELEPVTKPN
jgi:hypothetical protein